MDNTIQEQRAAIIKRLEERVKQEPEHAEGINTKIRFLRMLWENARQNRKS